MTLIGQGTVLSKIYVSALLADAHQEFKKVASIVKGQAESMHFICKANDLKQLSIRVLSQQVVIEQLQYMLADIRHEYYRAADNKLTQSESLHYLKKAVATQAVINQLRGRNHEK